MIKSLRTTAQPSYHGPSGNITPPPYSSILSPEQSTAIDRTRTTDHSQTYPGNRLVKTPITAGHQGKTIDFALSRPRSPPLGQRRTQPRLPLDPEFIPNQPALKPTRPRVNSCRAILFRWLKRTKSRELLHLRRQLRAGAMAVGLPCTKSRKLLRLAEE